MAGSEPALANSAPLAASVLDPSRIGVLVAGFRLCSGVLLLLCCHSCPFRGIGLLLWHIGGNTRPLFLLEME